MEGKNGEGRARVRGRDCNNEDAMKTDQRFQHESTDPSMRYIREKRGGNVRVMSTIE